MTGPQPGVGSPIIQTPILRPTDVVREPGLDQSNEIPPLARLLMAKGQLALENEKFQAQQQQLKQHKQMLDQMGQGLAQLFQNPQNMTPEGMPGTMGQAASLLAAGGETGGAAAALRDVPGLQTQARQGAIDKATAMVLQGFANTDVRDPKNQAELYTHLLAVNPDAAFKVSEGLKNLRDPNDPVSTVLGNDGGIYVVDHNKKTVQKMADTGQKPIAGGMTAQTTMLAARQAAQDLTDMEELLKKDPQADIMPTMAAMARGAKTGGGILGAIAGAAEPLAQRSLTPNQMMFQRRADNFIDHYTAVVLGRRAAGSPTMMNLIRTAFFPVAQQEQGNVRQDAAAVRRNVLGLLMQMSGGKQVDMTKLPGFSQGMQQEAPGAPAPAGGNAAPVTFDDLLQGPPKP